MLIFNLLKLPSYTFSRSLKTDKPTTELEIQLDYAARKKHPTDGGRCGVKGLYLLKYRFIWVHGCSRAICLCWLEFYETKPHVSLWTSDA